MKRTHDKSWHTEDRAPPGAPERFLTVDRIGPKRELMKNGYLVCYDVPVARVGWMLYGPGQVPVVPNPTSNSVYVERTEDELFDPATVASFVSCPLVNDHPSRDAHPDGVTPDNTRELVGGYLTNIRRGTGDDGDVLLGDIVVTRRDFIDAIQGGKREISAGYDAAYENVRPGVGRQHRIIANHIALVDRGRCGPRCAIGDHATNPPSLSEEHDMPDLKKPPARRRFDADALDVIDTLVQNERRHLTADDDDDSAVHVHVHMGDRPLAAAGTHDCDDDGGGKKGDEKDEKDEKYDTLAATVESLVGTVTVLGESMRAMASGRHTQDAADAAAAAAAAAAASGKKTEDSAALAGSWQDLVSKAEVLVPGFSVPTFDSSQTRALTMDAMCSCRRGVLGQYAGTADGKAALAAAAGPDFDLAGAPCPEVAILFNAAAAARSTANNTRATHDAQSVPVKPVQQAQVSASTLNEAHRKYWSDMASGKRA